MNRISLNSSLGKCELKNVVISSVSVAKFPFVIDKVMHPSAFWPIHQIQSQARYCRLVRSAGYRCAAFLFPEWPCSTKATCKSEVDIGSVAGQCFFPQSPGYKGNHYQEKPTDVVVMVSAKFSA